jgi:hypothetical protein
MHIFMYAVFSSALKDTTFQLSVNFPTNEVRELKKSEQEISFFLESS